MTHSSKLADTPMQTGRRSVPIVTFDDGHWQARDDTLAVERALEIHVAGAEPLLTMRTPGHDRELVAGLLHGEGVVESADDIVYLKHSPDEPNVVRVMLKPAARSRLDRIERNTLATSACGVCGKPSFRAPQAHRQTREAIGRVATDWILGLPGQLRAGQGVFDSTGGLHAAALFDYGGGLIDLAEDVGRHNALDKLIGRALLARRLPLMRSAVMLSGRASFELLQKSVAAGVPFVAAISAPSSFAVALAEQFEVTLIGFLRDARFNIYSQPQRVHGALGQ